MAPSVRSALLDFPPFRLDLRREELSRGQEVIRLEPKVYALLRYLAERPQELIHKRELLNALWGDVHVGEAVLKAHLNQVRRALSDSVRRPSFVETVHGRGYRFVAPVRQVFVPTEREASHVAPNGLPILVGRDAELQAMLSAWTESGSSRRRILFLMGEAGIGKTSLILALTEALAGPRSEVLVASGHCIEHGSGEPYLPILEAFSRVCRGPDGSSCLSLLRQCAPNWLSLMPELSEQPLRASPFNGSAAERMLREIANAILTISRATPLLLILEDLHWADYSTLGLIELLATTPDSAGLLIVGTYRSQELSRPANHPLRALRQRLEVHARCQCIELDYLTREDVERYLDARFKDHRFPVQLAHAVHGRTSGNPLFLVRVLDDLVKQGTVREIEGAWQLGCDVNAMSLDVPDSVVALIERDLDRLEPLEGFVLEAASVVGGDFDAATLAAALEGEVLPVDDICMKWSHQGRFLKAERTEGRSKGWGTQRYTFQHALYQHVVYERIGPMRRAHLHLRAGAWLESGVREGRASAATLARHFEQGNEWNRAIRYRQLAADQAMRRGAYREGIDHYEVALSLVSRPLDTPDSTSIELDLWLGIGVPLAMTRGYTARLVQHQLLDELRAAVASFPARPRALRTDRSRFAGARYRSPFRVFTSRGRT